MKLETGKPMIDGRYVVFVPGSLGWLEPHIVLWHRGKWAFTFSSEEYPDTVYNWIGPLPVLKLAEKRGEETQFPDEPEDFDL